jgi:nicotinic acid mononucleotide adenylyltransferase
MDSSDWGGKPCSRPKWPSHFSQSSVEAVGRKLRRIFDQNASTEYFSCEEIRDYSYYESLLIQGLEGIDRRMKSGSLKPVELSEYPKIIHADRGKVRACIYIGSFDPFQLTHLAVAVRFLASELSNSDFVIVVPEGSPDPAKPLKTDYAFRLSIAKMQIEGIFEPFLKVLDLGMQADTIEIVRRFIAMHRGLTLELTHLIGSDVLPVAARYIAEDMSIWRKEAQESGVHYLHSTHVVQRGEDTIDTSYFEAFEKEAAHTVLDSSIVATPSSTDFRTRQAFTIVLPTTSIRDKMEIIFRYHMHRSWSSEQE